MITIEKCEFGPLNDKRFYQTLSVPYLTGTRTSNLLKTLRMRSLSPLKSLLNITKIIYLGLCLEYYRVMKGWEL